LAAGRRAVDATRAVGARRAGARRLRAVRAAGRGVLDRGRFLGAFLDFFDFAGPAARLRLGAVRPFVRLVFALAMTLLVRTLLHGRRRRWDVVRLV
jgi:hypothetical protein